MAVGENLPRQTSDLPIGNKRHPKGVLKNRGTDDDETKATILAEKFGQLPSSFHEGYTVTRRSCKHSCSLVVQQEGFALFRLWLITDLFIYLGGRGSTAIEWLSDRKEESFV